MVEIVNYMHQAYEATESRLKAEAFRQRVMISFRAWEEWNVYPAEFLIHLQNVFLGLVSVNPTMQLLCRHLITIFYAPGWSRRVPSSFRQRWRRWRCATWRRGSDRWGSTQRFRGFGRYIIFNIQNLLGYLINFDLGVPLDGAALLRSAVKLQTSSPARFAKTSKYDGDVDGVPSNHN